MASKFLNEPPYHKILIVDDEPEICRVLADYLSDYEVVTASTVPEALEIYNQHKIFLVITDYQLTSDINGIQLSQKLRDIDPERSVRFCLITGFGEKALVELAINSGFHGYIEKPFNVDLLLDKIGHEFQTHKRDIDEEQIMIQTFFEEANEFLDSLETLLIGLAHTPENLRQIKRILHTLKGMAGLFGDFKQIEQICHHTEDVLPANLDSKEPISNELIDILVFSCDETRALLQSLRKDRTYRADLPRLLEKISVQTETKSAAGSIDKIAATATVTQLPDKADGSKKDGIYIPTGTLDQFMLSIGELISVRNFLENVLFDPNSSVDAKNYRQRIGDIYAQLGTLCHQLHNDVMEIRKVPIKVMFKPYFRIVRNLAVRTEKQIDMVVNDHDIMVDTNIIKHLSDALIHILKNGIDHGIEKPAERLSAGKPPHGTIKIEISQDRTNTYISIADDGRGLNTEKILRKAITNGLVSEAVATTMVKDDIYNLILLPGFSTSDTINEMSGRGIGLDAVKRATDDLGGRLLIETTSGSGTSIILTIPQIKTININRMIIYRIRSQLFASKLQDIRFVMGLKQTKIQRYDNDQTFIDYNGEFINIAQWLPLNSMGDTSQTLEPGPTSVVIVFYRGKESIAIIADELLDIGQLVVGELAEFIDIQGFSGKTILKTGKPALIITPQDLIAS